MTVLEVSRLSIGIPDPGRRTLVHGLDLVLEAGGALGLTGSSGAGKTLTACALCGLLPEPLRILGGGLVVLGEAVDPADQRAFHRHRGRGIFLVFQSPAGALNPISRVGEQVAEALWAVRGRPRAEARREAVRLMEGVDLDGDLARRYPHQLSGGQRQRVLLATAFALEPRILIADEPTSGLDDATQDQVLDLLAGLRRSAGTALIMISHDLRVLARSVEELLVLHEGRQVEAGPVAELIQRPVHPHTAELVRALRILEEAAP